MIVLQFLTVGAMALVAWFSAEANLTAQRRMLDTIKSIAAAPLQHATDVPPAKDTLASFLEGDEEEGHVRSR